MEEELRKLGFGYRAKYISQTARYIMEHHDEQWLDKLRELDYDTCKTELMKLAGGTCIMHFPTFSDQNLMSWI